MKRHLLRPLRAANVVIITQMLKSDVRIFVKLTDHDQFFLKTATAQKKKKKKGKKEGKIFFN